MNDSVCPLKPSEWMSSLDNHHPLWIYFLGYLFRWVSLDFVVSDFIRIEIIVSYRHIPFVFLQFFFQVSW